MEIVRTLEVSGASTRSRRVKRVIQTRPHSVGDQDIMIAPSDAADEPAENFDRVTAINLRGVWACMKHELRQDAQQATARRSGRRTATPSGLSLSVVTRRLSVKVRRSKPTVRG